MLLNHVTIVAPHSTQPHSKCFSVLSISAVYFSHKSLANIILSDYSGKRQGYRVVSLGEKPYFDPDSMSRRQALGQAIV